MWDSAGNVGLQSVYGAGGDTPGVNLAVNAEFTNAATINDLQGVGFQTGIDGGEILVGEGGFMGGAGYTGGYGGGGLGIGTPIGFSGYVTNTETIHQLNIYDLIDDIKDWLNPGC